MNDRLPKTIRAAHDGSKLYFPARHDEGAEYIRADIAAERERELVEALGECIAVMKRHIHPKPDVPEDHPFAVLSRASKVYHRDGQQP